MAVDAFLKIDGITGEAMDSTHANWIDVLSFGYGVTQTSAASSGGGLTAGKANLNEFTFSQKVHLGSPEMFIRCCTGKTSPKADFVVRKSSGDAKPLEFLKITMKNVVITKVEASGGSSGDEIPTENVGMTAEEMSIYYQVQTESGAGGAHKTVTFNQKLNTHTVA
ncbi:MAG: type VI secretion system tube protein Hcp [Planctomycetota bacterium]|nr:type VI secretion system tube protein Hcp [Planctomycetota bacterium]